MKLLFDQNLSFRLVKKLEVYFPDSGHVRLLGMDEDDDRAIWQYAKDNGFTIVTQDADFENLSQLYGFPPKVIWLRCGNTATANILNLLITNHELLLAFGEDDLVACLELRQPKAKEKLERKYSIKLDLMRRLLRHGFSANYIRSLLRFIDWVIQLPKELEQQLSNVIEKESEGIKVPYVTSWERRGREQGLALGKLQLVLQLLKVKFGSLDEKLTTQIEQLPVKKLEKLAEALLGFTDVTDLERWLKRRAS